MNKKEKQSRECPLKWQILLEYSILQYFLTILREKKINFRFHHLHLLCNHEED